MDCYGILHGRQHYRHCQYYGQGVEWVLNSIHFGAGSERARLPAPTQEDSQGHKSS